MKPKFWWENPLRIVQTVLREIDIKDYNPIQVLSYLENMRANVIVINAGGIEAFYPTEIPLHRRNPFMREMDILKELVALCHSKGIKVIGRVDFRGAPRKIFEEHPDWFSYELNGKPRIMNDIYMTCPNSPYRNEYAFKIIEELFSNYELDGIWENAVSFGGLCFCPYCKDKFRNDTGLELPKKECWEEHSYKDYLEWRYNSVLEHCKKMKATIKSFGEEKAYIAEFPSFSSVEWVRRGGLDINLASSIFDFLVAPCFVICRGSYGSPFYPIPIWGALEAIKYLGSIGKGKTTVLLFSHLEQTSRYTAEPPEELKIWMYQALAGGASLWDCTFVGASPENFHDKRNIDIVKGIYLYHQRNEEYYSNLTSIADVALVHSRRMQDRFGDDDPTKDSYITHFRGYELALLEDHITFDIIPDTEINLETLQKYKCIILPNCGYIPEDIVLVLDNYVNKGGSLIATFETSLYNVDWKKLSNFKLATLFGVDYLSVNRGPLPYSYQLIKNYTPLTEDLENTSMLALNGYICITKPNANSVKIPLTLIPEIFPQPPEFGWTEIMETSIPTAVMNEVGEGRVVYFPTQIDKLYYTDHHPDYGALLKKAVRWALKNLFKITINAPKSLYINLTTKEAKDKIICHLVNTTSSPSRPLSDIFEVKNISISLREDRAPKRVYSLIQNEPIEYIYRNGKIDFEVPNIREYEAIVIEFQ